MRIIWQVIDSKEPTRKITKLSAVLDESFARNLEKKLDGLKLVHKRIKDKLPSTRTLEKYSDDGICPTPDGCKVEPDGTCQHGWNAWLLILGAI